MTAIFFLPHTPSNAKFLSADEQMAAAHRLRLDAHGSSAASKVEGETFSWFWVGQSFYLVHQRLADPVTKN